MQRELHKIRAEIREHLSDQRQGEMLRDGVRTAIIGAPNVGKSSFLNLMCKRQISIVTDIPGTTRDIIESAHNFGGYPVRFSDTAGLRRSTSDRVEQEGIKRAKDCVDESDLVLLLLDAVELNKREIQNRSNLEEYVQYYLKELDLNEDALVDKCLQLVINKIDLITEEERIKLQLIPNVLCISCKELRNIDVFLDSFESLLKEL